MPLICIKKKTTTTVIESVYILCIVTFDLETLNLGGGVLTRVAFLQLPVVSGFKVELDNKGSRFGPALKRSTSAVLL